MPSRLLTFVALLALVPAAHAGTPLICHPYTIGSAKTLPGDPAGWKGVSLTYDRKALVDDTLALLTPETPVLVRMETLRRAAITAAAGRREGQPPTPEDEALISALIAQLQSRAAAGGGPLASFDLGFFVETLRHIRVDRGKSGYELIRDAARQRGGDPAMEFALALASAWPHRRPEHVEHVARAREGAKRDPLLAENVSRLFGGT